MKILCLCSALDLRFRYGCTPAWWQFFKGLYELGHDVIAVPYQGDAIESPWWRVYSNPCRYESQAYGIAKKWLGGGSTSLSDGPVASISNTLIESWVQPRWESALRGMLAQEKDVDAILVLGIPVNHFSGLPDRIRGSFSIPIIYYDGDVPASLPRFGGFASGFKIYEGASLAEYDAVVCNSTGGVDDLRGLGARRVETIHWGVDPALYAPLDCESQWDVFFYGYGAEYRESWMRSMLTGPSRALVDTKFAVGGQGFSMDLGKSELLGDIPFSVFRQRCCQSRINLNITRDAHASVFASSSMRPFELAAMGCCIVSNPVEGMDTWFREGEELITVNSEADVIDVYKRLLGDEGARREMGARARARVLAEHTHIHRAGQLADFLSGL